MARKPNYSFEKNSRAKAKATKREAKRLAKLTSKMAKNPTTTSQEPECGADYEAAETGSDAVGHNGFSKQ
jgi:hypothetical protein